MATLRQSSRKQGFVSGFQKTRPKVIVNMEATIDNATRCRLEPFWTQPLRVFV